MIRIRLFRTGRHFNSIFLWFSITISLFIVLSLSGVYYKIEKITVKNELENSEKILNQAKYNVEYIDDTIKKICALIYSSEDIQSVMYNKHTDEDLLEITQTLNKISGPITTANPFIDSIYVYNRMDNTYYTYRNRLLFNDVLLKQYVADMLESRKEVPMLKPIYRKIRDESGQDEEVFTYFMFSGPVNGSNSGIIINVKSDWIVDNIEALTLSADAEASVFVFDGNGELISNPKGNDKLIDVVRNYERDYDAGIHSTGKLTGTERVRIGHLAYFLSYIDVTSTDMFIVKMQQESIVLTFIGQIRTTTIYIGLTVLLLSLIASITISNKLYKPMGNLIKLLRTTKSKMDVSPNQLDEFHYLSEIINRSNLMIDKYESERQSFNASMKNMFIRKLIFDSKSVSPDELEKVQKDSFVNLVDSEPMAVCIAKIDDYENFKSVYENRDGGLMKFAIANIINEVLSSSFKNDAIALMDDLIVIVVNIKSESEWMAQRVALFQEGQRNVQKYLHLSVSVSISDLTNNFRDITQLYHQALELSMYRFIYGQGSIVTFEQVKGHHSEQPNDHAFSYEKKLVDQIKSRSVANIHDMLSKIFDEIRGNNYNTIILSLHHLVNTVQMTINEINKNKLEPLAIDFTALYAELNRAETIEQYYQQISELIESYISNNPNRETHAKHAMLAEAVVEFIDGQFHNNALNVEMIASSLKVSEKLLNNAFKEFKGVSIADYLLEYRLTQAADWLGNSDLPVNEIVSKVGMGNENYFYSVFKRRYGCTPKQYRMTKTLKD